MSFFFFLKLQVACMIFETIVKIVTSIGDEGCPIFNQCVGVGLVILKLGLVECYCGCMTPFLHGRNLSRLGFDFLRRGEYWGQTR